MSQITNGTITAIFGGLFGPVNPSGYLADEITREGVAGIAFMITGYRGEAFQARSWATCSSYADAAAAQVAYLQLKNTLCTLTDDPGNVWNYIFVRDVQIANVRRHVNSTNGSTHMIEAVWTLQSAATVY